MSILDGSIVSIHQALIEGKVTPLELTKEAIARAKADPNNAFELIDEAGAIAFASSLTEPEIDNYLWGIPYVAKDNFSTKGIETTASSNILSGYIPLFDATVIAKLKARKAILIGKTTMDELAMGGSGTTGRKGTTYNPYSPDHRKTIGGSSCGSAAATATSIVPFALGSDTGDSVRKPASYAGLVGLKPTWGRISRYGLFPFAPSLDHVAFFTRCVEDASIVLEALSGRDDHDMTSSTREVPSIVHTGSIAGKKIAVILEVMDVIHDKVLLSKFNASIEALRKQGAIIDYVSLPRDLLESIYATYFVISCAEATSNNANLDGIKCGPYQDGDSYQEVMIKARTKGFSELIKRRFVIGSFALMKENQDALFLRAQRNRHKIVDTVNAILKDYDFIYLPSAPSIAPDYDASADRLSDEYLIADNHQILANLAGLPAISIPLGLEDGYPLGAHLMGRAYEEASLLEAALALEDITGMKGLSILNRMEGLL